MFCKVGGKAMHKAYRFRLYPTRTQAELSHQTIGAAGLCTITFCPNGIRRMKQQGWGLAITSAPSG
ncbi:helix-turn-helix domain-containing protein [Geobacillus kaustophilus]|uniref:helix-turn-helix domain-containing protein n=1 Tax=Geobacillus kaustophilus TaxID=1462 RepID=UPI002F42811D